MKAPGTLPKAQAAARSPHKARPAAGVKPASKKTAARKPHAVQKSAANRARGVK
jgi:hypothetical protein